jgi:glycosyltransferase involved in cell wall biosynthesis
VQRLASVSVRVTGTVPDATAYVRQAQVCVAPLLAGGGSRLKILEALALRRAVVSTSMGADGLDVQDGEHALLADRPSRFAAAVVRLLDDAALRRQLGTQGRALVEARYDRHAVAPALLRAYDSLT